MKKIALLSAATAATFAFAPAAIAAPPAQKLEVKLTSTKAGTTKKPTSVGITVNTGTTSDTGDAKLKHTLTYAKISLPKGIKLNYKSFPGTCDLPAGSETDGPFCETNKAKAVGSGSAEAQVVDVAFNPTGVLTPYVGSNGRLLIRTQFETPAVIDQYLVGKVATSGGAYSFDFNVPVSLQTPIPNADQQINKFEIAFKKQSFNASKKKKVGLVELTSCPKGGYVFKGEFKFKTGETVNTSTTLKCSAAKK